MKEEQGRLQSHQSQRLRSKAKLHQAECNLSHLLNTCCIFFFTSFFFWYSKRTLPSRMNGGFEKACHRCISKIASNACFIFGLLAFLVLPLSMAFTGMKFLNSCPVQPLIPLYLLVGGVVGTLKVTILLFDSTRMRQLLSKSVMIDDDDEDEYPWRQNAHKYYIHLTLSLFLFLWFILGNYWVFSVYLPNFIPPFHHPQDYCDKILYIFAAGVLVVSHTVLVLLIFCSCCIYCCSRQQYATEED